MPSKPRLNVLFKISFLQNIKISKKIIYVSQNIKNSKNDHKYSNISKYLLTQKFPSFNVSKSTELAEKI